MSGKGWASGKDWVSERAGKKSVSEGAGKKLVSEGAGKWLVSEEAGKWLVSGELNLLASGMWRLSLLTVWLLRERDHPED